MAGNLRPWRAALLYRVAKRIVQYENGRISYISGEEM